MVGYLGYDVVREVERLPGVPADDKGWPDAVLSVIGELAAYDHWNQRVTLVANAFVGPGAGPTTTSTRPTTTPWPAWPGWPPTAPAPSTSRSWTRPWPTTSAADRPPPWPPASTSAAVEAAKEHILSGDIFQVVLAQRFDFDLRPTPSTCTGCCAR